MRARRVEFQGNQVPNGEKASQRPDHQVTSRLTGAEKFGSRPERYRPRLGPLLQPENKPREGRVQLASPSSIVNGISVRKLSSRRVIWPQEAV